MLKLHQYYYNDDKATKKKQKQKTANNKTRQPANTVRNVYMRAVAKVVVYSLTSSPVPKHLYPLLTISQWIKHTTAS